MIVERMLRPQALNNRSYKHTHTHTDVEEKEREREREREREGERVKNIREKYPRLSKENKYTFRS